MPTLAIAILKNVEMGDELVQYINRIDETLLPFGGRFLVHGETAELLEGNWNSDLVIIQFPDREHARGWYISDAYQAILKLRTRNSDGDAFLIDTVADGHRATDILL